MQHNIKSLTGARVLVSEVFITTEIEYLLMVESNLNEIYIFVLKPKFGTLKQIIKINQLSVFPKYRQIIDSLYQAIDKGTLKKGDKIPSVNQICSEFKVSRDTVLYAFNELKSKGILISQPGKGYYLATCESQRDEKIFILFDELNAYMEDLYNSLVHSLKGTARVELLFHHSNPKTFKNLIKDCAGRYTSYVIMPGNFENTEHLFSKLPADRVFLLDRLNPGLQTYAGVYQDFETDSYEAMVSALPLLKKYMKLIFLKSGGNEPAERVKGFERFCREHKFNFQAVDSVEGNRPSLYEAWFVSSDHDLVKLVKLVKEYKYKLGRKFGIVSFNDTLLKEVVAGGITTISTDYAAMGRNLAEMLLNHNKSKIRNPSKLIVRKSL